jgi:hypothetical protein
MKCHIVEVNIVHSLTLCQAFSTINISASPTENNGKLSRHDPILAPIRHAININKQNEGCVVLRMSGRTDIKCAL